MMDKLKYWGESIFPYMTMKANEYGALNLAQGFPDFSPDPSLLELTNQAIRMSYNQYAHPAGLLLLRESIAKLINNVYNRQVNPDTEITIVPGATFGIFALIQTLINSGDEVIIFEPAYDSYSPSIALAGGTIRPIQTKLPEFEIDFDEIKSKINQSTRLIIINNPNNPSTKIWSKHHFDELFQLVRDYNCYILVDEVYEFMNFRPENHYSLNQHPELKDRSVIVSSFGKSLHCTGWKLGYCVAPATITHLMRKVIQYSVFSTNHPLQFAVSQYLENHFKPDVLNSLFKEKHELIKEGLKNSRLELVECDGTYFYLLKYDKISELGSMDFAHNLVKNFGIATIPLSSFYSDGYDPGLLRICFAKQNDTLNKALDLLCRI